MRAVPEPRLAADFDPASAEQWRALVAGVLAKSGITADDPVEPLTTVRPDGLTVRPLYTAGDAAGLDPGLPGAAPYIRGASADGASVGGWDVRTRHADPDAARVNDAILADLERGANSIWLVLGPDGAPIDELDRMLDGVYLDLAPIVLQAGASCDQAAQALITLAERRGVKPADLRGSLGADPIGIQARTGAPADLAVLARLADSVTDAPHLCVATVDGTVYADAGGTDVDELAITASVGVAYLRALTGAGASVDAALDALEFRYAVTADQFSSIAKLRAARQIWGRVAELSGASAARRGQRQHAVTSAAMLTRRDPWVNMLRTTIACFSAAVGGAEAITVLPFDAAIGLSDDFARRIARNTSAILHDESGLGRVVDAAGGSWYVESLTDQLASAAWERFTELERAGGALAALEDATIGRLLTESRERRSAELASRRAALTGVSEFAFPDEAPVTRPPAQSPAEGGRLPRIRYAEDFERLRDRTDAVAPRPAVFLAALGPVPQHTARVAFATNLFQAAGLRVVVGTGEPDDLVTAFVESGTAVACLCSSDRIYREQAASEAAALKAAGARYLWLAGTPGKDEESDRSAGVDGYVFTGCDALEVLRTTLDVLEVPA